MFTLPAYWSKLTEFPFSKVADREKKLVDVTVFRPQDKTSVVNVIRFIVNDDLDIGL